jgi:hypothetical protein
MTDVDTKQVPNLPSPAEGLLAMGMCGGRVCAVMPFMFTAGLLVDYSSDGQTYDYSARYCYENKFDALLALAMWNGLGDPPLNWVKEKVSERLGPGAL